MLNRDMACTAAASDVSSSRVCWNETAITVMHSDTSIPSEYHVLFVSCLSAALTFDQSRHLCQEMYCLFSAALRHTFVLAAKSAQTERDLNPWIGFFT